VDAGVVEADVASAVIAIITVAVGVTATGPRCKHASEILAGVDGAEESVIAVVRSGATALAVPGPDNTGCGCVYGTFFLGTVVVIHALLVAGTTCFLELVGAGAASRAAGGIRKAGVQSTEVAVVAFLVFLTATRDRRYDALFIGALRRDTFSFCGAVFIRLATALDGIEDAKASRWGGWEIDTFPQTAWVRPGTILVGDAATWILNRGDTVAFIAAVRRTNISVVTILVAGTAIRQPNMYA